MTNPAKPMTAALIAVLIPIALLGVWWAAVYNRLVGLRQHLRESCSDIEVELVRRLDLIPNLVAAAKGYADHERGLLETVARLRAEHVDPSAAGRRGEDERGLEAGARRLIGLAESYPELKADAQFLRLQNELGVTEDRIAAARRFYNANVRDLNEVRLQFPTSIVASAGGFDEAEYFQPDRDRPTGEAPGLSLGSSPRG